uniref:Uncharacterized protein n=1 Tax=Anguilla anguilla TaxID=7936 RepID=A0A0E9SJE4_ANGAN
MYICMSGVCMSVSESLGQSKTEESAEPQCVVSLGCRLFSCCLLP